MDLLVTMVLTMTAMLRRCADGGCAVTDNDEGDSCADNVDNDGDGWIDVDDQTVRVSVTSKASVRTFVTTESTMMATATLMEWTLLVRLLGLRLNLTTAKMSLTMTVMDGLTTLIQIVKHQMMRSVDTTLPTSAMTVQTTRHN